MNTTPVKTILLLFVVVSLIIFCKPKGSSHDQMIGILAEFEKKSFTANNQFYPEAKLPYIDSLMILEKDSGKTDFLNAYKATFLLQVGEEQKAINLYEAFLKKFKNKNPQIENKMLVDLAIAYLRLGEKINCITNHGSESCIMPIKGSGIHKNKSASRKAIEIYQTILKNDPADLESRWLLNIAYMTVGEYPSRVPKEWLIPEMEGDTIYKVKAFQDIAMDTKLDVNNMAGGSIVDDFDNDGYLDIVTSSMGLKQELHYFKNDSSGTFTDLSDKVGLKGLRGGLNILQTDYNNDGYKDIFVLRGAWKMDYGNEPNSLIRNNGDGTFTDVTIESGLLSFHPTQTAAWNDFNNDGWLDLFIGNETSPNSTQQHPCELYINNQDGTFTEIAKAAHCDVLLYVKGVTSGDYDHDGWKDLCLSSMNGKRVLLKNRGGNGKEISFEDVTRQAGLDNVYSRSFPTWFWDYDNDGWLDIFVCDYTFERPLSYYTAAEKLNISASNPDKMLLYRNNHDGTFTNVAKTTGLDKVVFAMGANFGDIDNDGFLDMYLGTGNPDYRSLVPNKMFKNLDGQKFADVTASARVGSLQKGHAVSFADLDNDGDQDIYIDMGGAYIGDAYQNSFFLNPGQNTNNWICMTLEGTESNRAAIGTSIKITFKENGISRSVYRDVNSGGSFGSSPLRREIGIGKATQIDEIEIKWHGSGKTQTFINIQPNQFIKITEGSNDIQKINLKTLDFTSPTKVCVPITAVNMK